MLIALMMKCFYTAIQLVFYAKTTQIQIYVFSNYKPSHYFLALFFTVIQCLINITEKVKNSVIYW